ncbi:MAG: hypothetical protein LBD17_05955 [Endomicrobium sp.]|jgi:hypothetical protein|nr:hypothetical protein [Endomicrobium sp.]
MKRYLLFMFCLLFVTLFVSCKDRSSTNFTKSPASTDQKGSSLPHTSLEDGLTPDSAAKPGSEMTPVKEPSLILKPGNRLNIDDVINNNNGTFNIIFSCKGVPKTITAKVLEFSDIAKTTTDEGTPFGEMEDVNGGVLRVYIVNFGNGWNTMLAITAGEPSEQHIFRSLNAIKYKDPINSNYGTFLTIMLNGTRNGVTKSFQIDKGNDKDCHFQYSNLSH